MTARWMTELLSLPLLVLVLPPYFVGCLLTHCQDVRAIALGAAALALLTVWGSIVNHFVDWQTDAINNKRPWLHQHRPRSSLARYQRYVLIAYSTLLIIGFLHQSLILIMFLAGFLGALQYSAVLKVENRLWLNGFFLASAYGVYPLLVGLAMGGDVAAIFNPTSIVVASFLLFLDLGVAPFKDYGDLDGDRRTGKRTLPNVYGLRTTVKIQAGMIALALIVVALQQSYRSHETWLLMVICIGLLLLLLIRQRVDSHHAEFLHYAALLACCGRFVLLTTAFA